MPDLDIAKLLSEAVTRLNDDEIVGAEASLRMVLDGGSDVPQAQMLMGVVRLRQKRPKDAEIMFRKIVTRQPDQPATLYYLGNALRDQGDHAGAVTSYRKALLARPAYQDAELALAASLRSLGELEEAKAIYQRIMARAPQPAEAASGLGAVLNELGEHAQAEKILATALKLTATSDLIAEIENNLGIAKMSERRFAESLPHFERAVALVPNHPGAARNRARVLDYLNQPVRAADAYRRVLANDPLDLKTHLLLNELLHRSGQTGEMLRSYDEAGRAHPSSPVPHAAKGDQLLLMDRPAEAAECYRRALWLKPDHLAAHIGLARALSAVGESDSALKGLEAAQEIFSNDADFDTAFAYTLLRVGDTGKALTLAERAIAAAPTQQAALAVLGLCYRAEGDEREDALNRYDSFVQIFDLEPPSGYDSIASFHDALRVHLDELHGHSKEFFSQTLRGGTRTVEDIFELHHPLRDLLKQRITEAVGRYIGAMTENPDHPFLSRRQSGAFRFSGSWSSRMGGGGHHMNHIHNGWISSVYYVDVPRIAADTNSHQGWLKFGEPSADLGFRDAVRRLVQPKPGRLVLFPSYLWHGTVPFHSDETRMTIAFDAVPSPEI
ncbi:MAG TPA: tetratricopeptide repeat protein [Rhizomicrobium sp.]|nr:tetratricopeptide repeat protein [Rhizomicrobium sp.]